MRARKLKRLVLLSALVSMLSVTALQAEERATGSRVTRPPASAQESRRVVPFKSDKTDSWMCQNVSAFWCSSAQSVPRAPSNRGPAAVEFPRSRVRALGVLDGGSRKKAPRPRAFMESTALSGHRVPLAHPGVHNVSKVEGSCLPGIPARVTTTPRSLALAAGCATSSQARSVKPPASSGNSGRYFDPAAGRGDCSSTETPKRRPSYTKILLESVTIWDDPKHNFPATEKDLRRLADGFHATLRRSSRPTIRDGRQRADVCESSCESRTPAQRYGVKVASKRRLFPISTAALRALDVRSGNTPFVGEVSIEICQRRRTGVLLAASADRRSGPTRS